MGRGASNGLGFMSLGNTIFSQKRPFNNLD